MMTDNSQDELAIQRFIEYIQIKTVQPEPDYDSALKFLKTYAQELGLEYQAIKLDQDRHAAVLTVYHFSFKILEKKLYPYILVVITIVDREINITQFTYRCGTSF